MTVYIDNALPTCPVPHPLTYSWGARFVCDGPDGCGREWVLHNDGESFIGWLPTFRSNWRQYRHRYDTHNPQVKRPNGR